MAGEVSVECSPENPGYEELSLTMTNEAPLVGFHGIVEDSDLIKLGLILLDTISEDCQRSIADDESN